MTVLVVNHDPLEVVLLTRKLAALNYGLDITALHCGVSAWEFLCQEKQKHVSALVLDPRLCCLDGIALLRAIRRLPHLAQLPVFLWYSMLNAVDMEELKKLGLEASYYKGGSHGEMQQSLGVMLEQLKMVSQSANFASSENAQVCSVTN